MSEPKRSPEPVGDSSFVNLLSDVPLDVTVELGRAAIRPGDVILLDADGAAVVERERVDEVLEASLAREEAERVKRAKLNDGALSYELDGLRGVVEEAG